MTAAQLIEQMLAAAAYGSRHSQARADWARAQAKSWHAAQQAMDDRLTAIVNQVSEEEFERLFAEEDAKVAAIRQPLEDAAHRDRWPRELYFSGV